MHPDHARPDELADALSLIFRHQQDDERRWRVSHALRMIGQGDLDARGVFVLRDKAALTGALICTQVAGGGSLIWPPSCRSRDGEDALVRRACTWLRDGGAHLTQCLLQPDEAPLAPSLLRNGFAQVTDLLYLAHDLFIPAALPAAPSTLRFEPYDPGRPDEFHATLERTYEGTLDCPEVNGLRSIEEVIRGHQAQGAFVPSRWQLARAGAEPAGVLLLMEQPDGGDWEAAYVGLVPGHRGRGLGRELMAQALCEAKAGGAARLTLSVDRRNGPAVRLYRSLNFEECGRRLVLLAVWR
jgi:ribosomal protein S18 acetylase RimI-like enzyme